MTLRRPTDLLSLLLLWNAPCRVTSFSSKFSRGVGSELESSAADALAVVARGYEPGAGVVPDDMLASEY